jgi:hypothetical protein
MPGDSPKALLFVQLLVAKDALDADMTNEVDDRFVLRNAVEVGKDFVQTHDLPRTTGIQ